MNDVSTGYRILSWQFLHILNFHFLELKNLKFPYLEARDCLCCLHSNYHNSTLSSPSHTFEYNHSDLFSIYSQWFLNSFNCSFCLIIVRHLFQPISVINNQILFFLKNPFQIHFMCEGFYLQWSLNSLNSQHTLSDPTWWCSSLQNTYVTILSALKCRSWR